MTTFECAIVGLLLFGLVLPIWIFYLSAFLSRKMQNGKEPSVRYFAYAELLEYLHKEIREGVHGLGPLWISTIRELRNYPEYYDISLLYLEEIKITGSNKFDHVMENELKETQNFLLGRMK
ncbi:MAG: hypothetical protein ABJN65_15675 [Parasphingorhabdus sp.]